MHVECHLQSLRGGGFAGGRHAGGRHAGGWHAGGRHRVSARARPRAVRNSAYGLIASGDGLEEAPLAPRSALFTALFPTALYLSYKGPGGQPTLKVAGWAGKRSLGKRAAIRAAGL